MIHEILPAGRANPRTGRELADFFGCDIRAITIQIEKERREGWPICAASRGDRPGYFMAEDDEELEEYCTCIHGRALELLKTRRALLKGQRKRREAQGNGEERNGDQ